MLQMIRKIMSGNFLIGDFFRHQARWLALVVGLLVVWMFSCMSAGRLQQRYSRTKKQVAELRYAYLDVEAERSDRTLESKVYEDLHAQGSELRPNTQPLLLISK